MSVVYTRNGGSLLDNLPDVLVVPDVQQVLRINRNMASELLRTGQIKGWKVGSRWRIAKSALIAYIERAERNDSDRITHST